LHTIAYLHLAYQAPRHESGARVVLFPDYDMMVVMTGGYYLKEDPLNEILIEYIIPALGL
jgi:hypothetical protein